MPGRLPGHVDTSKVVTLGHSAGGGTAVRVAAADPTVRGWVALAGVPAPPPSTPVPSLMMSGSSDKTVPTSTVRTFYGSVAAATRSLVVIDGYGHNVFDDVCTVNGAHGGVVAAVRDLHLPVPPGILQLATDGCSPPDHPPPTAWPLIDQAVTATAPCRFRAGQRHPAGRALPHDGVPRRSSAADQLVVTTTTPLIARGDLAAAGDRLA